VGATRANLTPWTFGCIAIYLFFILYWLNVSVGSNEGAATPSFVVVSTGFAGRAGRLRSKLSLRFSPTVSVAHRRKVRIR